MQMYVGMDHNIAGHEELVHRLEVEMAAVLVRFSDQITRVGVHLSEENAEKSSGADKRCSIEARPVGRLPIAVSDNGATVEDSFRGRREEVAWIAWDHIGPFERSQRRHVDPEGRKC